LRKLIADGKDRQFFNEYANMKVLMINYGYQTALRSLTEQSTAGRMGMGVVVWTRGWMEAMWNGGIMPIADGLRTGNVGQARRGAKHFFMGLLGMYLIRDLGKLFFGERGPAAYDPAGTILGYGVGSPGMRMAMGVFEIVRGMQMGLADGDDPEDIAARTLRMLSYKAEHFLPLADVMINLSREAHDPETRHLWQMFKTLINKRGTHDWRTRMEHLQSWMFGSNKFRPESFYEDEESLVIWLMNLMGEKEKEESAFVSY
jgi:hypothetical protein